MDEVRAAVDRHPELHDDLLLELPPPHLDHHRPLVDGEGVEQRRERHLGQAPFAQARDLRELLAGRDHVSVSVVIRDYRG